MNIYPHLHPSGSLLEVNTNVKKKNVGPTNVHNEEAAALQYANHQHDVRLLPGEVNKVTK